SCTLYGTCNEEIGRCDCPKNRTGDDCTDVATRTQLSGRCGKMLYPSIKECTTSELSCLNACTKRGKCVSGWCHCKPGHYGADCSLSTGPDGKPALLAGSGYVTRQKRPWVYIYELPPHLTVCHSLMDLGRSPCQRFVTGTSKTHGVPGGMVCRRTQYDLGRCPRIWLLPNKDTWPSCGRKRDWYSAGIRQKVLASHWNRTGYHVVRSEPKYGTFLAQSVFCLAPPGAGHGQRQIQALFMGCVPVTIADSVSEPFEPAVSWEQWGVRVAEADIPRMHDILAAITPEQLRAKQAQMHCAAQHMLYSSMTGAVLGEDGRYDAFESTLEVLRVRRAHPAAPQADFRRLDPDFDAFMDCRDPSGFKRQSGLPGDGAGPQGSESEEAEAEAEVRGPQDAAAALAAGEEGDEGGVVLAGSDPESLAEGGAGEGEEGDDDEGEEDGAEEGGSGGPPPPPGAVVQPHPPLCSHSALDMRRHERACYYLLRGSGYMGVPGGAMCAKGYRYKLAQCPRLWA
ncbi:putative glucuronosyltransferase, partial [Tetrabaena socialis]